MSAPGTSLRVGSLNLKHGGGSRRAELAAAIAAWRVDVAVLGEWSPNGKPSMRGLLEAAGLHVLEAIAELPSRRYGVAIVSRRPLERGPLTSDTDPSRLVHARVAEPFEFDVLGAYVPSGSGDMTRKRTFLADLASLSGLLRADGPPILLGGDLNGDHVDGTGHRDTRLVGTPEFARVYEAGWCDPFRTADKHAESTWFNPAGAGPGFKLDHLWVRGEADVQNARVLHELAGRRLHRRSPGTGIPITDHAAIEATLGRP